MKTTSTILVFLFSLLPSSSCLANGEQAFAAAVAKSISYVDQHENDVWPGFRISVTPSMLHFGAQHIYAFNFQPKQFEWEIRIIENVPVYYLEQDKLGIGEITLNYNFTVDGQPAYIFGYIDTYDQLANLFRFTHERFHVYQFSHFHTNADFPHYAGFNSIENVKLAYLEAAALKDYLLTDSKEALQDYLAINHYRSAQLDDQSRQYEAKKIIIEGMASYAGLKSMNMTKQASSKFIADFYDGYCAFDKINDCILRRHYYFTGTVIGLALDEYDHADWKLAVEKQDKSPVELLEKIFPMDESEIQKRVKQAEARADFVYIEANVEKSMNAYQAAIQQQQDAYNAYAGIEANYHFDCGLAGFIKDQQEFFIDGNLFFRVGVDFKGSCDNKSIQITFNHLPFLYETSNYNKLKLEPSTMLTIDGEQKSLETVLADNKNVAFSNLVLTNANTQIAITNRAGTLRVVDHQLFLDSATLPTDR